MTNGYQEWGQHPADQRADLEKRLADLFHLLRRFDELQEQEDALFQRYTHHYRAYKEKWGAKWYWLGVLCLTIGLSAIITLGAFLAGVQLAASFTPLLLALIASGVVVAVRNSRLAQMNAQIQLYNHAMAEKIRELAGPEHAPIQAALQEARQEFDDRFQGWFPERFLRSIDVGECWQIVYDHRASTVQEAVNRYLSDQHEQYLRDAASAQLAEQQRATRVAQMNGIINASMQAATIGAVRAEGAATRAALNATRTVRIDRR